jgi:nucleotide-binding universal stress UspA family protein
VLVLPYAGAPPRFDGKVLLAWDGGREAALALQLALPLLRRAASVRVAVFEPAAAGRTLADALAADPLPLLARHGVQAELSQHVAGGKRGRHRHEVGDALLALAAELPADLLVMGAYGHSRMRETILGGVTRTVFDRMTIPVLMAH